MLPGKEGKKRTDCKKSFLTAMKKADIEDFSFHDLRHTFASHLVMAGVPLLTVARTLGSQRHRHDETLFPLVAQSQGKCSQSAGFS